MANKNSKNTTNGVATLRVIAEGGVNIREFESFDAPIVGELNHGDTFQASFVGDDWVTTTEGKRVRNRPYILELVEGDDHSTNVMALNQVFAEPASDDADADTTEEEA